jgi:hypothetical protein
MKNRKILAFVLFCFVFVGALLAVINNRKIGVTKDGFNRNPAAIPKSFDFSNLKGDALAANSRKRLLQGAELLQASGEVGIRLGHFLVSNTEGKSIFVCNKYDRIRMRFESEGFAVGGEPASMTVETNCQVSQDLAQIAPVWVPYGRILAEKPGDFELTYRDKAPRFFQFKNIVDEWPREWVLVEISLLGSNGDNLLVDRHQIREVMPRSLRLSWR